MVEFRVHDSGIGISAEDLSQVFERFYRVERSRSRALGGSGIGLTIAKVLVEGMGGQIRAESAGPGQGSTFAFSLPVA
jgi:signal transduction histidine kinase